MTDMLWDDRLRDLALETAIDPLPELRRFAMRRAARIDGNHSQIVDDLRRAGASVKSLAPIGMDILVGWKDRNFIFEIKNPVQVQSQRRLTKNEATFFSSWRGQANIIETSEEAIEIMERYANRK